MLETEKAELLHRTPKIITTPVAWSPQSDNRYRIDVRVLAPESDDVLRLVCSVGKKNYSFVLLYQNYPIRKYTKHQQHTSRTTGTRFAQPHKHTWDKESEDDQAYIPTNIDPASDLNDQFIAFLEEENITLQSGYQRLMLSQI